MTETEKPTNIRRGLAFQSDNLEAAKIILEDIERYGGEEGAMVRWARMQVERY